MSIARNANVELLNSPQKKRARATDDDGDEDEYNHTACDNPEVETTTGLFVKPLVYTLDKAIHVNQDAITYCKHASESAIQALNAENCNEAAALAKQLEMVSTNLIKSLEDNVENVATSGQATLDGFEQIQQYWLKKAKQISNEALQYALEASIVAARTVHMTCAISLRETDAEDEEKRFFPAL